MVDFGFKLRFDSADALVSTPPVSDNLSLFYFKFLFNVVLQLVYSLHPGLFLRNSLGHGTGRLIRPICFR